jgi:hypothetical protein
VTWQVHAHGGHFFDPKMRTAAIRWTTLRRWCNLGVANVGANVVYNPFCEWERRQSNTSVIT